MQKLSNLKVNTFKRFFLHPPARETAFFALPEGTRGIYVGGGASVHVARLLGASRVVDMMLTARVLDAAAAERAGLVQYLVPEDEAKSNRGTGGKSVGDGAAHHSRRAAGAAAHPGHERGRRALRRELDGRALPDRSGPVLTLFASHMIKPFSKTRSICERAASSAFSGGAGL
jgi:enoyl-CoA hydratase/carnithine racemase